MCRNTGALSHRKTNFRHGETFLPRASGKIFPALNDSKIFSWTQHPPGKSLRTSAYGGCRSGARGCRLSHSHNVSARVLEKSSWCGPAKEAKGILRKSSPGIRKESSRIEEQRGKEYVSPLESSPNHQIIHSRKNHLDAGSSNSAGKGGTKKGALTLTPKFVGAMPPSVLEECHGRAGEWRTRTRRNTPKWPGKTVHAWRSYFF